MSVGSIEDGDWYRENGEGRERIEWGRMREERGERREETGAIHGRSSSYT